MTTKIKHPTRRFGAENGRKKHPAPGLDSTRVYSREYRTAVRLPNDRLVKKEAITLGQFLRLTGAV